MYELAHANFSAEFISKRSFISAILTVILSLGLIFNSRSNNFCSCRLQRNSAICLTKMSLGICLIKTDFDSCQWYLKHGKIHLPFNLMEKPNSLCRLMHISSLHLENLFYAKICKSLRNSARHCLDEINTAMYNMEDLPAWRTRN